MSTDEQDAILGRLLREITEAKRNRACYEAKLGRFMEHLRAIDAAVQQKTLYGLNERGEIQIRIAPEANEVRSMAYPAAAEIVETVQAIAALTRTITEKEEQLARCTG